MKNSITLMVFGFLFFSCSDEKAEKVTIPTNATDINLAIGIEKDADLNTVFTTLNSLNFDVRQLNGFFYNSNTPQNEIPSLIDLLNQKSYINTGAWRATTSSVYFDQAENTTRILNSFFEMNSTNQSDLLNLIATLNLEDRLSETKNIYLSVPVGSQNYWKDQMMNYDFVKWSETFDQICLRTEHANVLSANVPASGIINQNIPIDITFEIINGCGAFGNIVETISGTTTTLVVNAKYEGCICTQVMGELNTTYNFIPTATGVNTIKIQQPNGQFLSYSIVIQ